MNEIVSNDSLEQLKELVEAAADLSIDIEQRDEQLKELKDQLRNLLTNASDLMQAVGLDAIVTKDRKIERKKIIKASLNHPQKDEAIQWLHDNNCDGLIKDLVSFNTKDYPKETVEEALQFMHSKNLFPSHETSIHHKTLESFVREQLESEETADTFPKELFDVREIWTVNIKPNK